MSEARVEDALRLVCIVDGPPEPPLVEALDPDGGISAVWVRMPGRTGAEVMNTAAAWGGICANEGVLLIVGDRPDVAMGVAAETPSLHVAVQLGFRGMPPGAVRPWFPAWIGASCHDAASLAAAAAEGADYAVLGPVFAVPGKGTPLGVRRFATLVEAARIPVVGVGGMGPAVAAEMRRAGAVGVAAIRSLRDAATPRAVAREMRAAPPK